MIYGSILLGGVIGACIGGYVGWILGERASYEVIYFVHGRQK